MQLKITTDYAVRTVLYLARTQKVTTAGEIAEAMGIPKNYLVCMIGVLRKAGIVCTQFGQKGGYYLGGDPHDITLYDIIILTEGALKIADEKEKDDCIWTRAAACTSYSVYKPIQDKLEEMLRAVTIADLLEGNARGSGVTSI